MASSLKLAVLASIIIPGMISPTVAELPQEPGSLPGKNGPPPQNDAVNVPYSGVVTTVTKKSITLRGTGENPKQFLVSEALAAGNVPATPRIMPGPRGVRGYSVPESHMYRLTDVKVGDWVAVRYAHIEGSDTCDHICIAKRPGGRVPPLPEEAEDLRNPVAVWKSLHPGAPVPPAIKQFPYIPHHVQMNAYWDLEDKGIPYPEKFGPDRRFPVAPPPREVPPLGPAVDP